MGAKLLAATQTSIDRDAKIHHFQLLCTAVSDGQKAESALWQGLVFFYYL